MYNHAPENYECPFCPLIKGLDHGYNRQSDIIYQTDDITAFLSPKWWLNNPGNVLIVPNQHYENLYDMPENLLAAIAIATKKIALAMRATYDCHGTSTRQHNEPAGGQDVWHFHIHVFPRYIDDKLYQNHDQKHFVTPEEKAVYINKPKEYLKTS